MRETEEKLTLFCEALEQAAAGSVDNALTTLSKYVTSRSDISIKHEDKVSFENDDGFRYTKLRREYSLTFQGTAVIAWWEECYGYRGSMGAGWFIEVADQDGPPDGLTDILDALGIKLPELYLPRPD
jgi:hypothetical protein